MTDDTDQAILPAELLVEGGGWIGPDRFARALLVWEARMIPAPRVTTIGGIGAREFTHKPGDRAEIAVGPLGTLVNTMTHAEEVAPWVFGVGALMRNLAERGLR